MYETLLVTIFILTMMVSPLLIFKGLHELAMKHFKKIHLLKK
jgi:hypothetical protein